jgi:hypothetical protein
MPQNTFELTLKTRKWGRLSLCISLNCILASCILDSDPVRQSDTIDTELDVNTDFHEFTLPYYDPRNGNIVPESSGSELIIPKQSLSFNEDEENFFFKPRTRVWDDLALSWSSETQISGAESGELTPRQYIKLIDGEWSEPFDTTNARSYQTNEDIDEISETYMGVTSVWAISDEGGEDLNADGIVADKDGYDISQKDISAYIPAWLWADERKLETGEFSSEDARIFAVTKSVTETSYTINDAGTILNGEVVYRFQAIRDLGPSGIDLGVGFTINMLGQFYGLPAVITYNDENEPGGLIVLDSIFNPVINPLVVVPLIKEDLDGKTLFTFAMDTETLVPSPDPLRPGQFLSLRQLVNAPAWVDGFITQLAISDGDEGTTEQAAFYFGEVQRPDIVNHSLFFNDAAANDVRNVFADWRIYIDSEND